MTGTELLRGSGLPVHEAERLLVAASGLSRSGLRTEEAIDSDTVTRFLDLVSQRKAGRPLQHLEGTVQFGPIEIETDARALIPRPETEQLWEMAVASLREAGPGTVIVDLCTGSGNLALALKHAFPAAQVIGTDIDPAALDLARENASRTGVDVSFFEGDLFEALPERLQGRVDLIVANPPYVAESDFEHLPADVRLHDPRRALVAGAEGTEMLARIADDAYWWVGIGGWVLCEIGHNQAAAADRLFAAFDREVRPDLAGRDRFLVARKGASCCV